MKSLLSFFTVALALGAFAFAPLPAQDDGGAPPPPPDQGAPPPDAGGPDAGGPDQDVSYQTFYDQLADQGSWIQTDNYGYVFQPNEPDPNWAPYTDGRWAYTEAGWTWISNDPWGWATDHYGRWAFIDGTGWIWVPGDQWAPAWVSWRFGGGYAGWAPLPPDTLYGYGNGAIGFHFGPDVDSRYHIGAGNYHFVREGNLGSPNLQAAIVSSGRNATYFKRTANVTNITVNYGGAAHGGFRGVTVAGPPLAQVNAHATHQIPTMQLAAGGAPGRAAVHGNSLSIYAPRINPATAHQAKPAAVTRTLAHPTFNTGTSAHVPAGNPGTVRTNAAVNHAEPANTGQPSHEETAPPVHREQPANTGQSFHPENAPAPTHHEAAPANNPAFHPQTAPQHQNRPPPQQHTAPPPQHTAPPPQHGAPPPPGNPNQNRP